jgi:uncharacterized protein YceK
VHTALYVNLQIQETKCHEWARIEAVERSRSRRALSVLELPGSIIMASVNLH